MPFSPKQSDSFLIKRDFFFKSHKVWHLTFSLAFITNQTGSIQVTTEVLWSSQCKCCVKKAKYSVTNLAQPVQWLNLECAL